MDGNLKFEEGYINYYYCISVFTPIDTINVFWSFSKLKGDEKLIRVSKL